MTTLLEQAFVEASKLSLPEQGAFAAWLFEELQAELRWSQLLADSPDILDQLADEALAEL
jgi:hypothetical protein